MDFLTKLKEKPKPAAKKPVKVNVPVKISTQIVDKRDEDIDRNKIIRDNNRLSRLNNLINISYAIVNMYNTYRRLIFFFVYYKQTSNFIFIHYIQRINNKYVLIN